jgi:hypothetical protein
LGFEENGAIMSEAFALMTVKSPTEVPSLESAATILRVSPSEMDTSFGVVPIDPEKGLYAVQVRARALVSRQNSGAQFDGPFSNPRIEGFGPKKE